MLRESTVPYLVVQYDTPFAVTAFVSGSYGVKNMNKCLGLGLTMKNKTSSPCEDRNQALYIIQCSIGNKTLMKYFFFHTKRSSFHGPEVDSLKKKNTSLCMLNES